MQVSDLGVRITQLVGELSQYHGYRTVWIDLSGRLVHSEPDEELEKAGFLYVTTALRPDGELLTEAVSRFVTVAATRPAVESWSATEVRAANLVPA